MLKRFLILSVVVLLTGLSVVQGQATPRTEVYVMRTPSAAEEGHARLFFVDSFSGEFVTADVAGDNFTIVGDYVITQDVTTGQVMQIWPDGRLERHPFIQPGPQTVQIDWVVSPNQEWIAWMLNNQTADGLQASINLARSDGTASRVVLTDAPDNFMQVVPIALTDDWQFFYDKQPQGVANYAFYPLYASIHRVDAGAEAPQPELLPFEPNCYCGAGFSENGDYFARLEKMATEGGYAVNVWNLSAGIDALSPSLPNLYQDAGHVLVSNDGRYVAYSLANNVSVDGADSGRERFTLALVDVAAGEQTRLLYNDLLIPLVPIQWTEDGSGLMLVDPRQDGTWKLELASGTIQQVAGVTYIGVMQ